MVLALRTIFEKFFCTPHLECIMGVWNDDNKNERKRTMLWECLECGCEYECGCEEGCCPECGYDGEGCFEG